MKKKKTFNVNKFFCLHNKNMQKKTNKQTCNQQQNVKFMMMLKVGDISHLKVLLTVAHIINPVNPVTILRLMEHAILIQDTVIIRVKAPIRLFFVDYLKRRFLASLAVDRTNINLPD